MLECFFGTSWFAQPGEVLDSVEASAKGRSTQPPSAAPAGLWEVTPFYCPDCGLNYCGAGWDTIVVFG